MAVIADRCPNVHVQVVDINQARIDAWNDADLGECRCMSRVLTVWWNGRAVATCISPPMCRLQSLDMVFISVNTPPRPRAWVLDRPVICAGWKPAPVRWPRQQPATPSWWRKAPCGPHGSCSKTILEAASGGEKISAHSRCSPSLSFWRKERPSVISRP